jgi:Threonine aldolase
MGAECVVVFDKSLFAEARYARKQACQLASKLRYVSCQFTAFLTGDLWLKCATHANKMAKKLYDELVNLPGVMFTQKPESNQLFLIMPREVEDKLYEKYHFYFWNESVNEMRLVTSFDTTDGDVDNLVACVRKFMNL